MNQRFSVPAGCSCWTYARAMAQARRARPSSCQRAAASRYPAITCRDSVVPDASGLWPGPARQATGYLASLSAQVAPRAADDTAETGVEGRQEPVRVEPCFEHEAGRKAGIKQHATTSVGFGEEGGNIALRRRSAISWR